MTIERALMSARKSSGPTHAVLVARPSSDFIVAYAWSDVSGFGARYSNPSVLPTNAQTNGICFSPDKSIVFVLSTEAGYINAYAWNTATGFGTKYAELSTGLLGTANYLDVSPDGKAVVVAYSNSGNTAGLRAFAFDSTTGFGAALTNPNGWAQGAASRVAVSPGGTGVVAGTSATPYFVSYRFSSITGFGNKIDNPTAFGAAGYGVAFHPSGSHVAIGTIGTAWRTYTWTEADGLVSVTNRNGPSTRYSMKWSAAGDAIIAASSTGLTGHPWNSDGTLGTAYTATGTVVNPQDCAFSATGGAVFLTCLSTAPHLTAYPFNSSTGFGTKYADPSVLPNTQCRQIACV